MNVELPFQLGAIPIEWLLTGLPALAAVTILFAIFGGDGVQKQTRRRIERIRDNNGATLTPQQMISIRRAGDDSGIALVDSLVRCLVPRPELLRLRLESAGLRTT